MPDLDSLANAKGNLRNRAQALNAYAANSSLQQQYSAIQNSYNDLGNAAMPQQLAQPPAPSLVPSSRAVWIDGKLLVIKRAETQTGGTDPRVLVGLGTLADLDVRATCRYVARC